MPVPCTAMPSIGARVRWSYVLTVERRRRFIDTKPHWPQTSRAAGWMPPPSWHASSLSCNWSFTFGASQYLYKQSHLPLRIDFFFLTPFPCTDGPEILHARHKNIRLKIPRSSPPSAHAFARSPTNTAKRPKTRVGSGVFEPFHSAHGPADDGWRSLQDPTFRRRIQRWAFRALGSKTRGVRF